MRGAGGGRPSKGAAARNRAKPTVERVVLPKVGPPGPAPKPMVRLEAAAGRLWKAMWTRPEAWQWAEADVPALTRLVVLQLDPRAWLDPRLLSEMRQLEDRYGMNPYARKQMRWVREDEEVDDELVDGRPAPVRRLRPVDPAVAAGE